MRIAYLIRESREQIVSPCYYELVEELQRRGNEITVLNESGSFEGFDCVKVEAKKVISYPFGAFNKLLYSKAAKKILAEQEQDIVFGSIPESVYFLNELRAPKAVMVQDNLKKRVEFFPWFSEFRLKHGFIPLPEYTKFGAMVDLFFQQKSLERAEGIVFMNRAAEKEYKKSKKNSTRVIPNGVNFKEYRLDSKTKEIVEKIKEEFGEKILLFMGRLDLQKNPLLLVRAAEKVLKENNAFFLIAGNGIMRKKVEKEIQKKGLEKNVKLLGWKKGEEKKALLHACSAFVLPSLYESMPLALLEAMACSKPCIVSGIEGMEEAVDKSTGIKFSSNSSSELSEAINFVLSEPKKAKEMGKNAEKKAERFYDWKIIAKKYESFFYELKERKEK